MDTRPILCILLAVGLCLASASGTLRAEDGTAGQENSVARMAAELRADLAAGEKYPDLNADEHRRVLELLGRMEARMGPYDSVDQLTSRNQVRLYNEQNEINAILTGAADSDRLVCQRMRISGSHRSQNICITAAEWEERAALDRAKFTRYRQQTTP